jgi:hypothetical protein
MKKVDVLEKRKFWNKFTYLLLTHNLLAMGIIWFLLANCFILRGGFVLINGDTTKSGWNSNSESSSDHELEGWPMAFDICDINRCCLINFNIITFAYQAKVQTIIVSWHSPYCMKHVRWQAQNPIKIEMKIWWKTIMKGLGWGGGGGGGGGTGGKLVYVNK